jgi:hypothetical protein
MLRRERISMRSGGGKSKTVAGRKRDATATLNPAEGREVSARLGADSAHSEPIRGPGSKLIHELGGTLATIGLHLRMAIEHPLPPVSAQHLEAAAEALHSTRDQLTRLAELVRAQEQRKP